MLNRIEIFYSYFIYFFYILSGLTYFNIFTKEKET